MRTKDFSYYKELAFSKKTSTAFIVDSPLQILCAAEAILEFEIDEYILVVGIETNDSRTAQVMEMLQTLQLKNRTVVFDNVDQLYQDLLTHKGIRLEQNVVTYQRVMIGNFYALDQRALGVRYASNDSVIVYLDDGCGTISMLYNVLGGIEKPTDWTRRKYWYHNEYKPYMDTMKQLNHVWAQSGVHDYNFLYSLYYYTPNPRICIYPNKLTNLKTLFYNPNKENAVYIIGPSIKSHASGLKPEEFEAIIWTKLVQLKQLYPQSSIYYIPHGRDVDENIPHFCQALDIQYLRLSCAAECYFLTKGIKPNAIYGFGSSALWTLKMISPDSDVFNWLVDNHSAPVWPAYLRNAKYYEKYGGIETKTIPYPNMSFTDRCMRYIKWCINWSYWKHVFIKKNI